MKLKYNDKFLNKRTGELEEREQYGFFGNIFLSEFEKKRICKYANELDVDINEVITDADEYIEYHWEEPPISFMYLKAWIDRKHNYALQK